MSSDKYISGIHHVTAIAASASENVNFYENVLRLRLVKQTVNFDDPHTYHLYYGDSDGAPGTIITFFPWEKLPRGKPGAGMVTAISFSIPVGSLDYWHKRLRIHGVETQSGRRFGEAILKFEDPHGLPLELIETPEVGTVSDSNGHSGSGGNRITGLHSATPLINSLGETDELLTDQMGMVLTGQEKNRYRFKMTTDRPIGQFYDVVVDPKAENGRSGSGTVHHIAFRTPNDDEQKYWQAVLGDHGLAVTPVRDRKYFRSIYFNEPGGVLFEIATDPPGFAVDEPEEELGRHLKLPEQYESMRSDIEIRLPKLRTSNFTHKFEAPDGDTDDQTTIVALHGTGGNEADLIQVAREVSDTSAIISPRGQVLENGMHRFFR